MNDHRVPRHQDIAAILETGKAAGRAGRRRWITASILIIVLAALAYAAFRWGNAEPPLNYLTEEVTRGNLVVTVSATGTLQPTNQVDVGSELSGTIERVLVDDNDHVKKGQELARLDTSKLQDQVTRSSAALVAAEAQVVQMQATVEEAQASLARLRHVAELSGGKVPSKAEMQTAEAALKRATATEASARAAVGQARATLKSDQTNLGKATIRSPIDGVVLARKVEPGQTVAASLQAPVLFTLAENLKQMKLEVDVDEADVGQVKDGQQATFKVDAYPNRDYPSRITRTAYGSQTKEGVVSYLTVLEVNNDDLSLRPGMTATASIVTASRENVLLVPNAALRFSPPSAKPSGSNGGLVGSIMPRPPRSNVPKRATITPGKGGSQQVWVLRDGQPVAVPVTLGASDGRVTEVMSGELQPGMAVITESVSAAK
ncbi:MAG TPA: efflux RND transporter periplasmic adaptor subunit [Noviherbaspirillum sp.]|uniref:efflux RND transporter periplasmic adaptor subunit n=1 Tax=Noviherbaspirillum sp. TaxID=1926288 RepID=UPI002B4A56DC|nr:efflux RND transporter periplasmic adaptor subunit [Noviherbaspirillum sp.]HJV84235.1 efflux RND transporter periplasmic adaptor subunit [Noviherbaspirillum sp.]